MADVGDVYRDTLGNRTLKDLVLSGTPLPDQ
jgi:hypothetical protein